MNELEEQEVEVVDRHSRRINWTLFYKDVYKDEDDGEAEQV